MNCRGIKVLAILLVAVFCQSFVALADERRGLTVDLCGIVTKTNFVEYMKYLDSIGFHAIRKSLAPSGTLVWKIGVQDAVWVMWQKDIVFLSNDVCCTEWLCPTNASINSLRLDVRQLDASRFDVLNASSVIANAEVTVFNTYADKVQSFINSFARRCIGNAPLAMNLLVGLDVSYLGAETNMLYITERGSLEDSVTYKNITLKIRYKDNSLSDHRKAIAEALMTAGVVTKFQVPNAPVLLFADDNAANGSEKKNSRENASVKDVRGDGGKVL